MSSHTRIPMSDLVSLLEKGLPCDENGLCKRQRTLKDVKPDGTGPKRTVAHFEYKGKEYTCADIVKHPDAAPGLRPVTFRNRMYNKSWTIERALTTPLAKKGRSKGNGEQKPFEFRGKMYGLKELLALPEAADGLTVQAFRTRYYQKKKPVEEALTTPVREMRTRAKS